MNVLAAAIVCTSLFSAAPDYPLTEVYDHIGEPNQLIGFVVDNQDPNTPPACYQWVVDIADPSSCVRDDPSCLLLGGFGGTMAGSWLFNPCEVVTTTDGRCFIDVAPGHIVVTTWE